MGNIMDWIGLFVLDKAVDVLFICDMVINFRSAYVTFFLFCRELGNANAIANTNLSCKCKTFSH